jgi:hypothetical protein
MNDPGDWSWFRELLTPLQRLGERPCPSRAILDRYVKGRLRDLWRVGARPLNPDDWTLTEVSQHALTCPACAQQLALMRRRESAWRELWESLPGALRAHCAAYVLVLFALIIANALLVTLVPAPTVALPCVMASGGPAQPGGSEMPDRALKIEGLNKPAKLPPVALQRVCAGAGPTPSVADVVEPVGLAAVDAVAGAPSCVGVARRGDSSPAPSGYNIASEPCLDLSVRPRALGLIYRTPRWRGFRRDVVGRAAPVLKLRERFLGGARAVVSA